MPDRVRHDKLGGEDDGGLHQWWRGGRNKFFLKNLWLIWRTRSAALRGTRGLWVAK